MHTDTLTHYSDALVARAEAAAAHVIAVFHREGRHVSGLIWHADLAVTSDQALPRRDTFDAVLSGGTVVAATVAGRDASTNIALLRLAQPPGTPAHVASSVKAGALALAYGSDGQGGTTSRLGVVQASGPAWTSARGGNIEKRIALDIRLAHREEGGPVFDASGGLIGMSTIGVRGQVLVIPSETLQRIVPLLTKNGRIDRGWLGAKLQPISVPDALRAAAGQESALMAMSIAENSPAATAGLIAGDIILSIGSASTRRIRRLAALLGPDSIGRSLEVKVIRSGVIHPLSLIVAARPAE
jgi:S1-C subfamily serine protease